VAGATEADDSGLVLLCPKSNVEHNIFADYAEYVTVVSNGKFLAPKPKKSDAEIPKESVELNIVSKVRKGHEGGTCQTVRVTIPFLSLMTQKPPPISPSLGCWTKLVTWAASFCMDPNLPNGLRSPP
jgi:hypothetical protein